MTFLLISTLTHIYICYDCVLIYISTSAYKDNLMQCLSPQVIGGCDFQYNIFLWWYGWDIILGRLSSIRHIKITSADR